MLIILVFLLGMVIGGYAISRLTETIVDLKCFLSKDYKSKFWHYREGIVFNKKTGKIENVNKLNLPFEK